MRILIAGGGTGGHIYPALAVVRSLRARREDVDLRWVGGRRGLEFGLVPDEGLSLDRLWLRSLRSVDLSLPTLLDPIRLGASFPQAMALLGRLRPAAIFTTGGYVALPVVSAAAALRVPVLLWEGNVVPGRSARVIARLVRAVAVSFASTCGALPGPCYVTGTPTRELGSADRGEARQRLGIPGDARLMLIFGGSQAVRRFDSAVEAALPGLVEKAYVLHLTGHDAYGGALARKERLPATVRDRYRPHAFLRDEMSDALAAADMVVGRAGSSTIAEVTAVGVPMIVVPYPHAAGHQRANARLLVEAGGGELVDDEDFDGQALAAAAVLLDDEPQLSAMGAASRSLGRPGAAGAVAELVLALAERRPLPDP
ncbi:MAG: UDP-N-acetylglucosamine--N-acetylmuramyl-(pentapeptide) pyrophosphoryl-undecaprenol N-acetylglucosamine transferase, partial [Chloroflexi bacterium]|nr:UDP-N-acetylglucosamine--N-acetylmuramyl-(pentapeptide) pyrophosphoryl-undecaprenol N-acetylglucosamine transferase [Chloroflexota bacterium]